MAISGIRFTQINLHHSKSASAILTRSLVKVHTHIALIQEPWLWRERIRGINAKGELFVGSKDGNARACIFIKGINGFLLQELSCRDCTTIRIEIENKDRRVRNIIICSAYLAHDEDVPISSVKKVVEYSRRRNLDLIIGCDANAHHVAWGSTDINSRGEALLEYVIGSHLEIINRGNEPTFITATRREVLDLTVASVKTRSIIHGWKVENEPSMSDHRTITFHLECLNPRMEPRRKPTDTDWESFKKDLCDNIDHLKGEYGTEFQIDWTVQQVQTAVIRAYENNCPLKPGGRPNSAYWWNGKLEALRKRARQAFNRAKKKKNPEGWSTYKKILGDFKRELTIAKKEAWKNFCSGTETLSDVAKLAKILTKDNNSRLQNLRDAAGSCVDTEEATLDLLLRASFLFSSE